MTAQSFPYTATSASESAAPGNKARKDRSMKVDPRHLRFFDENVRTEYGFDPEHEEDIIALVKSKYVELLTTDNNPFTADEIEFITSNLADPAIESDPTANQRRTMKWLVNSVIAEGVQDVIRVYWDEQDPNIGFTTDGNRRLMSIVIAKLLGTTILGVHTRIEDKNPQSADFKLECYKRQFVSNSGKELNDKEQAELVERMQKIGADDTMLISLVGNAQRLRHLEKLREASPEIQNLVGRGDIKLTTAVKVVDEALDQGYTHEQITEAAKDAVEDVKQQREEGKTKASKASKSNIENRLQKQVPAQPRQPKVKPEPKPEDEGDRQSAREELEEIIALPQFKKLSTKQYQRLAVMLQKFIEETAR